MKILIDFLVMGILIWIAVYDLKTSKIKNASLIPLLILAITYQFFYRESHLLSFMGSLYIVVFYLVIWSMNKSIIGAGDIKLLFILSLFLSLFKSLIFVLIANILHAVVLSVVAVFRRKFVFSFPFGPSIVASYLIIFYRWEFIFDLLLSFF